MRSTSTAKEDVRIESLGESLSALRLGGEQAHKRMVQSLRSHGQMTSVSVYSNADSHLEVIDGFKRLHAARALGWDTIRTTALPLDSVHAKVAVTLLNDHQGLTELEQAWLCRSLYREDKLSQPEIGQLMQRHKSWVSRRLLLGEQLDEVLQADVRLGLLSPRAAQQLARLPRGNQRQAAEVVMHCGLSSRQTEKLIHDVLRCEACDVDRLLAEAHERGGKLSVKAPISRHAQRTESEWVVHDAQTITQLSARLHSRLCGTHPQTLPQPASAVVTEALFTLIPVLDALKRRCEQLTSK